MQERTTPLATEEHDAFAVYCFSFGTRYESSRLYYEAWKSPDGMECLIPEDDVRDGIRLYLNFGQKTGVVFVRREGAIRPEYACWRVNGATKGRWRTIRFCESCPDPEACGYLDQTCRLSKNGKPQNAFTPKSAPKYEADAALFGELLQATATGQTWLNSIDTAYGVLHNLQTKIWQIEWARLSGKIYPAEAAFRQNLEERWATAIFEGRNPSYAVLPWNTNPALLASYILNKYYLEDGNADSVEEAPLLDEAIFSVIQCVTAAVGNELEWMLEGPDDCITEQVIQATLQNLAKDAVYHTKILLGLPDDVLVHLQPLD